MVSSSVGKRNTQKGTNMHSMQLHNCDITVTCFWDINLHKCTYSVLGMAQLQHGFGSILFTLAGEKVPSCTGSMPDRAGQHGMAWLGMMLACFGHIYTDTANCAEPCWYHAGTVSSGNVNTALDASVCSILPSKCYLHVHCRAAILF